MFETNANGQTYFAMAMKVIHRVLRTKIIQSDRNMVRKWSFNLSKSFFCPTFGVIFRQAAVTCLLLEFFVCVLSLPL